MNGNRLTPISPVCRLLVLTCSVIALMALAASQATAHSQDKDCADFSTQRAAQDHQDTHVGDPDRLNDDNGVTCPELPCPCGPTVLPPPAPTPVRSAPVDVPLPMTTEARVVSVKDGNTLTVTLPAGEHVDVRLIGVDAPKRRGAGTRGSCGAGEATARMRRLALHNGVGGRVTLRIDPTHDPEDRFARMFAYVEARGVDLGRALIASGWATVDPFNGDFLRMSMYRKAQSSARAAQRGAWRRCG